MALDGLAVFYATAGGVLLWSGFKGQTVRQTISAITSGSAAALAAPGTQVITGAAGAPTSNATAAAIGAASASGPVTASTVKGIANYGLAALVASTYGWPPGTQEFAALTQLIRAESGGNPTIWNGQGSGAFGIAQALGHGTAATQGSIANAYGPVSGPYGTMNLPLSTYVGANSGNASDQLVWMCEYIKVKFRTPSNAWSYHLANNSY